MPDISKRGMEMPSSPIRRLASLAADAKARGVRVYGLNIGQPDVPTPSQGLDALGSIDRRVLEYSPSDGLPSLRAKMAEYYGRFGIDVSPDEIIVTAGGSEALLFAFMACFDPGDEIIFTEPGYANYMAFAKSAGIKVVTVPSTIDEGFALPPIDRFREKITDRTRGILICNPNNPTGYVYSRDELEQLRDLVRERELFLFTDEVYREFCYTDRPYVSALQLCGIDDNVVLIDSVSKRYNECGIRIGALVTRNAAVRAAVMKFCQARLSPPLLGQIVAEASIDAPEEYMNETHDEYRRRRDFMIDRINRIPGCYSPMPMGAFYSLVRLPVDDADDFCRWCLNDFQYEGQTVFMAPASGFYVTPGLGHDQVRVAYVLCIADLARALDVLEKALEAYPRKKRL